jgi:tRNA-dihydrouridine synthase B
MILAPLRGVTIRCFRETFAGEIAEAGFAEAVTPFVAANPGYDPLKDRELRSTIPNLPTSQPSNFLTPALRVTPQFIGKDPEALRACLMRIREKGIETADLNCGCPYPMVRNKGRGSGLLANPALLEKMIAAGCAAMGEGKFSAKARLGIARPDELLGLMPMLNAYPLRFLTVHARTAKQMYDGNCDLAMLGKVEAAAKMPIVRNGDIPLLPADQNAQAAQTPRLMIGRPFVRHLGLREDCRALALRYLEASCAELSGDGPVLGRMKELMSYWEDIPRWRRIWPVLKLARSVDELRSCIV